MSRFAITGGTGFVGRHLARRLRAAGHEVVLLSRGRTGSPATFLADDEGLTIPTCGLDSVEALANAFADCEGVAHCAGINHELGPQTFEHVHIDGTRRVVEAARRAGASKIVLTSFLRARAGLGWPYHESKWQAEEIVRSSEIDFTILKLGVIFGPGDHMVSHIVTALRLAPIFATVGIRDREVAPVHIDDVTRIMAASLTDGRLSKKTVPVTGPERLKLGDAVRRIARVLGKRVLILPAPIMVQHIVGWLMERAMRTPLVSRAQVHMLSEGIVNPAPADSCDSLPHDLKPSIHFDEKHLRAAIDQSLPFESNRH